MKIAAPARDVLDVAKRRLGRSPHQLLQQRLAPRERHARQVAAVEVGAGRTGSSPASLRPRSAGRRCRRRSGSPRAASGPRRRSACPCARARAGSAVPRSEKSCTLLRSLRATHAHAGDRHLVQPVVTLRRLAARRRARRLRPGGQRRLPRPRSARRDRRATASNARRWSCRRRSPPSTGRWRRSPAGLGQLGSPGADGGVLLLDQQPGLFAVLLAPAVPPAGSARIRPEASHPSR